MQMEQTIEHERTTSSAVKQVRQSACPVALPHVTLLLSHLQLRNDLRDEKMDHEEKV